MKRVVRILKPSVALFVREVRISPILLDDVAFGRVVSVDVVSLPDLSGSRQRSDAYRNNFSIKSTWVSIMRRQQYLFRPS